MAEFKRLPTQEELSRMLYQQQLTGRSGTEIFNENLAKGTTIQPIPENIFQKMAGGAQIAKEQVNRLGNASDIAKLFPGYTGEKQLTIPTGYSFAPKQSPTGEVLPQGLQTQQIPYGDILKAIKPADMLGIKGAQQAYTDVGMGKAPNAMDVMDIAGLGAAGLGAGKGLLGVAKATKGLPVGMGIKDVSKKEAFKSGIVDEKIGNSTISYQLGNDGILKIFSLRTPQLKRGQGSASNAMNEITKRADEMGIPIKLDASPLDKKTSLNKLVNFYKKFGFEPTGEKVNMLGEPVMYREPSK